MQLKEIAPANRLILWAHISHLSHDSLGTSTSVGQLVHQAIGAWLYTIGVFAERGGTILIYDDTKDDIGYGRVHADRSALGRLLQDAGKSDYFMNLRPVLGNPDAEPLLLTRQPLRAENECGVQLARDFDGTSGSRPCTCRGCRWG